MSEVVNKRNYGIDLLRIIAMLMVVAVHITGQLLSRSISESQYYILKFIQTITFCAVDCYVIISGYVGFNKECKPSNLFNLIFQATFYTVIISTIFFFMKQFGIGLGEALRQMIPNYWYLMTYCGLFVFMPLLNKIIRDYSHVQLLKLLLVLITIFSIISTVFLALYRDPFALAQGFSVIWFIILYLIGGYLGKYNLKFKRSTIKFLLIYLICMLSMFLSGIISNAFDTYEALYSYISPTVLFAAISLVVIFSNLNISPKIGKCITYLSTFSFAVYLIHSQDFVKIYIMPISFQWLLENNIIIFVLGFIASVLCVYILCSVIDIGRFYFFKLLHIKQFCVIIEKCIFKLVNWIVDKFKVKE